MIGTTLKQRFYFEKELGRGGMGVVYRAIDQTLQRAVAIKVLKELSGEEVGKRLRVEAQILARLMHENIVRLYDFDEVDGTYYFIMEEVDGSNFFHRWRTISTVDRLKILAQTARALDYAHHQGIIHRDVKPGNILLTKTDQPKLSDFGLSVTTDATQEVGVARGTPLYMSPEQAKGLKLDHRSDLYALGVLLYECSTGSPPYQGNAMAIMSQHVNADAMPPKEREPRLSTDLDALIRQLMSKDPDARTSSGAVVADLLADLIESGSWCVDSGAMPSTQDMVSTSAPVVAPSRTPVPSGSRVTSRTSGFAPIDPAEKPSAIARKMISQVVAEPISLTPEERYLAGHYLAYFLGGSRRRGFFLRRPLDPLNSDRARLILAMTWLAMGKADEQAFKAAAKLLDERPDIRPMLNPIVVVKYLQSRDTPAKRKRFRQLRQQLQQASSYASTQMVDERGILNPGLMPQTLEDLYKIAPDRSEVDDLLVERWNRLTELWRGSPEFREAVLRYATQHAAEDPASIDLWPEVVYPLIERARWQRRFRSRYEAFWDTLSAPVAAASGVRMDRLMKRSVPDQVAEELEEDLIAFENDPDGPDFLDEGETAGSTESGLNVRVSAASLREIAAVDESPNRLIPLADPDPMRFNLGELRELWKEAIANLRQGTGKGGHRNVPVGPYRLAVVASIRSHKAGTVAIQGMANKQVEMLVPSFAGGSASRVILAVWTYENRSLAITYVDLRGIQRFILWDAATNQQTNFDTAADLNHNLFQRNMEVPDQIDRVLTRRFRPSNPV